MLERIGIVGLGRMGAALAARGVAEGLTVTGWTRSGGNAAAANAAGYTLVETLSDLAAASDILLLSLFDGPAVEEILDQLAAIDLGGKLVVETSTVAPDIVRRHAHSINGAGAALIDAPISGGPEMVAAGTIGLFIGGEEKDVTRFLPVAQKLSNRIAHVGSLGSGAAAKIVNNVALAGAFGAALEAMQLGQAMGLDLTTMLRFLEKSPGTSPMFKSRIPMIAGTDATVGFSIDGAVKDAGVFLEAAKKAGITLPAMTSISDRFRMALEAGLGERDVATVVRFVLDGQKK